MIPTTNTYCTNSNKSLSLYWNPLMAVYTLGNLNIISNNTEQNRFIQGLVFEIMVMKMRVVSCEQYDDLRYNRGNAINSEFGIDPYVDEVLYH